MRGVTALLAVALATATLPGSASGQPANSAQNCAIAAGGNVRQNTVTCGYTADAVAKLLQDQRSHDQAAIDSANEAVRKLSGQAGLTEGAIRGVLGALGKDQATIAPERLADALFASIGDIVALRQGLTRPANDAPEIAALKQHAVAELDAGHFAEADRLLQDIHTRQHAIAEDRAKTAATARADWLAGLQQEADTSALQARSALQQRDVARAEARFEDGIDTLAPAEPKTRWSYEWNAATALKQFGKAAADSDGLVAAVHLWKMALSNVERASGPGDWAATQTNLGIALWMLGERESGTTNLFDAVAAFRAALEERTRARVPLDWATTQNNLGNVLWMLGERESGTRRLQEAVTAYRAALEERTRARVPLNWAATQNNLGNALATLGERESGTTRLQEAVTAYRAALEEWTRARVPLDWAAAQNNLGATLKTLGERESSTAHLQEAVTVYRAALEELTRARVPLDWAMTQNNLGNALRVLGERESGTARLQDAVTANHAALEEYTRARVPLDWAITQENLGDALEALGERESGTAHLQAAIEAWGACLEVTASVWPAEWVRSVQAKRDKAQIETARRASLLARP